MNLLRVRQLYACIESLPEGLVTLNDFEERTNDCNTPACIAGWTCRLFNPVDPLKLMSSWSGSWDTYVKHATEALELTPDDIARYCERHAEWFGPDHTSDPFCDALRPHVTNRNEALDRLLVLIAIGDNR